MRSLNVEETWAATFALTGWSYHSATSGMAAKLLQSVTTGLRRDRRTVTQDVAALAIKLQKAAMRLIRGVTLCFDSNW